MKQFYGAEKRYGEIEYHVADGFETEQQNDPQQKVRVTREQKKLESDKAYIDLTKEHEIK